MKVSGTIPPMVTPVDDRGEIDVDTLREFTDELVHGGVHGLFPLGSTGEFSSLTRDQRVTVLEAVVEESSDRPVLAGCGGTSVRDVLQYIADAADAGADAAVVVTPFYLEAGQEGIRRFYRQVAAKSTLPIYLYNIPKLTGASLAVDSVAQLAEEPTIVGMKDSSGDFTYFAELLQNVPESFCVLQGVPMLGIPSLDYGADGVVAGPANVFPRSLAEFYEAHHARDRERALSLVKTVIAPVINAIQPIASPAAFKYLLAKAGRDVGEPLAPLPPLTSEHRRRLDACYRRVSRAESASAQTD